MDKENYAELVNKDVVAETVHLVEQKFKEMFVNNLKNKVRDGINVGSYSIISNDDLYDIYDGNRRICNGISSLDTAFSIVHMKVRNSSAQIDSVVEADKEYAKCKNDIAVYNYTIETSNEISAVMVAEDRLYEAVLRMSKPKQILDRLKTEVNAAVFDK